MKTITKSKQIGYSQFVFKSDVFNGEYLDTKVILNDQLLCVIAGNTINDFIDEMKILIKTYGI